MSKYRVYDISYNKQINSYYKNNQIAWYNFINENEKYNFNRYL